MYSCVFLSLISSSAAVNCIRCSNENNVYTLIQSKPLSFADARKHAAEEPSNVSNADGGENTLSPGASSQPAPSQQNVSVAIHIFDYY